MLTVNTTHKIGIKTVLIDDDKTALYQTTVGKETYEILKELVFPKPIKDMDEQDQQKLLEEHLRPMQFETTELREGQIPLSNSQPR